MNSAYWLNRAWMLSCAAEAKRFRRATADVASTQRRLLIDILRENQDSWFGRQHRFATIQSVDEYQQRVPACDYESLREPIDRIARGESGVLTAEPVLLMEPTGGSTAAEKLIPYTQSLRQQFQRAIAAWIYDVMKGRPEVRRGRAYWSISPLTDRPRQTNGGLPIGFEDDRDYLSSWQRWAVSQLLAVPAEIRQLGCWENARYATLLYLLACRDLALISVWSPTFLTSLIDALTENVDAICNDLATGSLRLPRPDAARPSSPLPPVRCPRRAAKLREVFAGGTVDADRLATVWPRLALISCWADAASALFVPRLRECFSRVELQPKGLLATEGVISIPHLASGKSVLALRSHFFEFAPSDENDRNSEGAPRLAHEVTAGNRYRVLLTTGGGLYRYELGDEIEVTGFLQECPLVRFLGRAGAISDLVGEKLSESHVLKAIQSACGVLGLQAAFALLAPLPTTPASYKLFVHLRSGEPSQSVGIRLARQLETELNANPQYRIAVAAGQLRPCSVQFVGPDAWERFRLAQSARGQKVGDLKPAALSAQADWAEVFAAQESDP